VTGQNATQHAESLKAQRSAVHTHIEALVRRSGGLRFACVSTADGRLFAYAGEGTPRETGVRIAAMTSSMLALGETFAKEAFRGRCDYSVISTTMGSIIVIRIPTQRSSYILSISSDGSEVLATTLRVALDSADRISTIVGLSQPQ
jgi:uncharacterized protein